jgi:hypothetical protein
MSRSFALLSLPLLLLISCSDEPKPVVAEKKEAPKAAEPLTAQKAFYTIFPTARTWSSDAMVVSVQSIPLADVKPQGGKYGAWQVVLYSPSKRTSKSYTYSIVEGEGNLHLGVFGGPEQPFNANGQQEPFLVAAFKTDSEDAYQSALKKSEDYIKKNPDKPVIFLLEKSKANNFPDPAWRVVWGESIGTSNYSVYIDATTGNYLKTAR